MMEVFGFGHRGYLVLSVLLVGIMFLTACGGGSSATGGTSGSQNNSQTPAPTVSINASATQIVAGSSSPLTLTVTASNTTQVVISDNCDNQTYTLQTTGGTLTQPIPVPTTPGTCTYTATATGANSQTAANSVAITVQPSTATTVSMTPAQQTIAAGQSATLLVTVANANSVYITNNVTSASIPVSAAGGTVKVTPTQTTTYTVTATGANNQPVTTTATVAILSVSVTAAPATIVTGSPTTLTVTAANASQVVVTDNTDNNTYTLSGTGGTQSVSPTQTTTYTATATGGGATATATVTVTVNATASTALINHVIFLMQENRTFDTYFGMLNPYRKANGWTLSASGDDVDGLTDANGVVGNFPTPAGIPNPATNNVSDPVVCPAGGTWEGITCTPGAVIYPATSFPLFKFATSCIDDMTSDWVGSFGDVSKYNFTTARKVYLDGFIHVAQDYADSCYNPVDPTKPYCGDGNLGQDFEGQRAMGYYDQTFLNYYYYMASQFALSDRWFSPVASKSTPNRIATVTGGTTQGLVYDPFKDDNINGQLNIPTIFGKLSKAGVSWRIYYGLTQGNCTDPDGDCGTSTLSAMPAITFADFQDSYQYLYAPATPGVCSATTTPSGTAVGDAQNAFCIDTSHIVPTSQYFLDIASGTTCTPGQTGACMPSFAFVEPAYGFNDEHPGSGQSILSGQAQVAKMMNALMASPAWKDSVFFLSYDEGGGPFDHVPPVPGHTNDFSNSALGLTSANDISTIAVNPDTYLPCPANGAPAAGSTQPTATLHCDLVSHGSYADPGYNPGDAASATNQGFAAQLGFRLPNMVVSPFTKKHYVGHIPMDHTAVIRFVEDRFIGNQVACANPSTDPIHCYLTNRDAVQPSLTDFFDFVNEPWLVPPTKDSSQPPVPQPLADPTNALCTPAKMQ